MADTKISELPDLGAALGTDELVVQRGGTDNFRISRDNLIGAVSSSPIVGAELFRWNGVDMSQFESDFHFFGSSTGGFDVDGFSSTRTFTVETTTSPSVSGPVIRMEIDVTAGAQGGGLLAVLASEVTLPSRYVIYVTLDNLVTSTTQDHFVVSPGYTVGSGIRQGMLTRRRGSDFRSVSIIDGETVTGLTLNSGGNLNTSAFARGGSRFVYEVFNDQAQVGPAPQYRVLTRESAPTGSTDGDLSGTLYHDIGTPSFNWNNQAFDRVGIGFGHENTTLTNIVIQVSDFRIYKHPLDL